MLEQEGKEWKDEAGVLTGLALGNCNRFPHIQLVGWRPNWKATSYKKKIYPHDHNITTNFKFEIRVKTHLN